jgi:hypothetical protein
MISGQVDGYTGRPKDKRTDEWMYKFPKEQSARWTDGQMDQQMLTYNKNGQYAVILSNFHQKTPLNNQMKVPILSHSILNRCITRNEYKKTQNKKLLILSVKSLYLYIHKAYKLLKQLMEMRRINSYF